MTRRDAFMLRVVVVELQILPSLCTAEASKLCDERHGGKRGVLVGARRTERADVGLVAASVSWASAGL